MKDDSTELCPAASALRWARSLDAKLAQAYITNKHVYLRAHTQTNKHSSFATAEIQYIKVGRLVTWK